ncbi:hypothetical protein ABPG74_004115 [Tetrahymena malaccensis]
MGSEQSTSVLQTENQFYQQYISKKKMTVSSLTTKLQIEPVEVCNLMNFLEQNEYLISDQELGRGGSGIVLSGEKMDRQPIAIKIVKCIKKGQVEGMVKEFNILKSIQSTHVVEAYDLLQYESPNVNILITIMDKCECNLTTYLRQIRYQFEKSQYEEKIYDICRQLIKGLNDIHSANILHLDIKPSNIMMGRDKLWKFIDMGISVRLEEQHFISSFGLTQLYSSPEQFRCYMANMQKSSQVKQQINKQSDIYSLGLVFLEMTGVNMDKNIIMQVKQNKPAYEGFKGIQLNSQFSKFNNNVILQMVQFNQENRCNTEYIDRQLQSLYLEIQKHEQSENYLSTNQNLKSHPLSRQSTLPINNQQNVIISRQSSLKTGFFQSQEQQQQQQQQFFSTLNNIQDPSTQVSSNNINNQSFSPPNTNNYGTSHILKTQNLQSNLQKNSYQCQKYFNMSPQEHSSHKQISSKVFDQTSDFYKMNRESNIYINNNEHKKRFSVLTEFQQY